MTHDVLREFVRRLNPIASTGSRAHFWTERPDKLDGLLEVAIDDPEVPVLILGPRGAGKTAMLNQIKRSLAGNRFVVLFRPQSPGEETSWEELFVEAILWLAYEAEQREVLERIPFVLEMHEALGLPKDDPYAAILDFASGQDYDLEDSDSIAGAFARGLDRTAEALAMPVVLLMDLSDALASESKEALFSRLPSSRRLPSVRLAVTGSYELAYSRQIRDLDQNYSLHFVRAQADRPDSIAAESRAFLRSVLAVRASKIEDLGDLIKQEALHTIIEHSAGLPRQLLQITRTACQFAIAEGKTMVDLDAAQRGIDKERERFAYLLDQADIEWFSSLVAKGRFQSTAPIGKQHLLTSNALVEYWDYETRRPFWVPNKLVESFILHPGR